MKKIFFILTIIIFVIILAISMYFIVRHFSPPIKELVGVDAKQAASLYNPEGNVIRGNPDGEITMVEFFSYDCEYCRKAYSTIQHFIKTHKNLRVVYKEFLLFGDKSKLPCYAALAAARQGKYLQFHDLMLTATRPLTKEEIAHLAVEIKLDVNKLFADMNDPKIKKQVDKNTVLSKELTGGGAPTLIFIDSKALINLGQLIKYKQYYQVGHVTTYLLDKLMKKVRVK